MDEKRPPESFTITTATLVKRINSELKGNGIRLQAVQAENDRSELGDYVLENFVRKAMLCKRVDPEGLGRDLGVLKSDESVEDG